MLNGIVLGDSQIFIELATDTSTWQTRSMFRRLSFCLFVKICTALRKTRYATDVLFVFA